ncbi:MAG: hypothetical protein R2822_14500 [Spirosomataceae bacterium]
MAEAEKIGAEFAKNAGYPTLKQLRALSTGDVYELYNQPKRFGFPVVLDNHFLPQTLPQIFMLKPKHKFLYW